MLYLNKRRGCRNRSLPLIPTWRAENILQPCILLCHRKPSTPTEARAPTHTDPAQSLKHTPTHYWGTCCYHQKSHHWWQSALSKREALVQGNQTHTGTKKGTWKMILHKTPLQDLVRLPIKWACIYSFEDLLIPLTISILDFLSVILCPSSKVLLWKTML